MELPLARFRRFAQHFTAINIHHIVKNHLLIGQMFCLSKMYHKAKGWQITVKITRYTRISKNVTKSDCTAWRQAHLVSESNLWYHVQFYNMNTDCIISWRDIMEGESF